MRLKNTIAKIVEVVLDPQQIYALLTWPKFSVTSYRLVSGIKKQGISPRTVIDVGANVGQFTIAMVKLISNVHIFSFEPLPEALLILDKNVQNYKNIRVYPVALGENEGEIDFHVNASSSSSSVLPLEEAHRVAFPNAREVKTIQVKISTLDKIFRSRVFESPVLLKLDVQGYEANTLRGGIETLKRVDYVILEVSFKPMYEKETLFIDMVKLMKVNGFRFLRPIGWLEDSKTKEILQADVLFGKE